MKLSSLLVLAAAVVAPSMAVPFALPQALEDLFASKGITIGTPGSYNQTAAAAAAVNPVVKRGGGSIPSSSNPDTPPGCAFPGGSVSGYVYVPFNYPDGSYGCFGVEPIKRSGCGGKRWNEQQFGDIQSAVAQHVTKEGQFTITRVGDWSAAFALLTTAFDSRSTETFAFALALVEAGGYGDEFVGSQVYFWNHNRNYMSVTNTRSCP